MAIAVAWYSLGEFKRSIALLVAGGAITLATGAGGAITDWAIPNETAPIQCASEYEKYGNIIEKYPNAEVHQEKNSPVQGECDINKFVDSIRKPRPNEGAAPETTGSGD
ncbi:hypothetical protein AB0F44_25325 [Nocardioides sp. NPDC023903]|uniref:hypothetical protein n=1 Tax=Nocardioides sp. NPDC023903 TaxID=3157195 RepID=UPI00340FAD92